MRKTGVGLLLTLLLLLLVPSGCAVKFDGYTTEGAEYLQIVRIVNQQLQEVFAPQLSGWPVLEFGTPKNQGKALTGKLTFRERALQVDPDSGEWVKGRVLTAEYRIENGVLTLNGIQPDPAWPDLFEPRFYQDFLIPRTEFSWVIDVPALDLSLLTVDESRLEEEDYRTEAAVRLSNFFGAEYVPLEKLKGEYAVVFSVDREKSRGETLAALAELDQTEGLSVTGIYYSTGKAPLTFCRPYRPDDRINPEVLDPEASLRALAVQQDIANMLFSSELYNGGKYGFLGLGGDGSKPQDSASPIGACVVVDEGRYFTPEMFEAVSKVCYRCIDVKLLTDY